MFLATSLAKKGTPGLDGRYSMSGLDFAQTV